MNNEQILLGVESKPLEIFSSSVPPKAININYALKEIKELLHDSCSYYELSRTHSTFYLSAELISQVKTDVWYDTGGIRIPVFSGIWVLSNTLGAHITVGNKSFPIVQGDLHMWETGKRITYSHENTVMLGFNIVTPSLLKNQDLSQWISLQE
jgi:hypothetical protein